MSYTFRPVTPLINALNAVIEARHAIYIEGPVVISVIDNGEGQYVVVTNFTDPTNLHWLPTPIVVDHNVIGYEHEVRSDLDVAQNSAWHLYLNMTYTKFDLKVRRKAQHAFDAAMQSKRLFNDLEEDYFDHGIHPTTLDDAAWEEAMLIRLEDQLWGARFEAITAGGVLTGKSRFPGEILKHLDELRDTLMAEHGDVVLDDEPSHPNDGATLREIDSDFPAWDDPEDGLEVRLSKAYNQEHGYHGCL